MTNSPLRQSRSHQHFYGRIFALTVILALVCAAPAGAAPGMPAAAPATLHALGDPQELEGFVDGVMATQLAEQHIPGAVVIVVKDGKVLLAKGYGYADVDRRVPVDAQRTLFRPGSVSKLFTWTAVMQLVEQGKLDLNADVNTYLTRFKIPATYPQPITLLDLMAHTPGFEDRGENLFKGSSGEMTSLEDYLAQNMPARVYPPGQVPAYSNYGVALAGYLVEQVSGEPYEQYVEAHVLKPLGMDHSTMQQPLPAALAPDMSQGYLFSGRYQAGAFEFVQAAPAGALSATGADMGKFMIAHLQDGEYDGVRILKAETAQLMHAQSYAFDPALAGMAHGFMESQINGRRLIGHLGDTAQFHTLLELIPEEQAGLYASYNSPGGSAARTTLLAAFMNRYFPGEPVTAPQPPADFASRAARYTGDYGLSRMAYTTPEKVTALFSILSVQPGPDNTLLIPNPLDPAMADTWVEVRPLVVQNTRTGDLAVFHEDEHGEVRYAELGNIPIMIAIKQPWYGGQLFQFGVLGFSLLMFLLTIIASLVAPFVPLRKREDGRSPWPGRLARWVAFALCVLVFAYVIMFALFVVSASSDVAALNHPPALLGTLPWAVTVLAALVALLMVAVWLKGWWGFAGRMHYTLVALAGLAFVWFELYWSLLVVGR
jgi:CubicO group peptidase (beta-lactamase class C family)